MRTSRHAWWIAGVVAGMAGLATSYFAAMVMTIRESPVVAVAELVIRLTPGAVVERAIRVLGHHDKTFLVIVLLVILGLLFAWAGRLARRSWWQPLTVFAAIAGLGLVAIAVQYDPRLTDVLPILVGFVTWVVCLSVLTDALRSEERRAARAAAADPADAVGPRRPARRGFLLGAGLMAVASVGIVVLGRVLGQGRRHVEETRRLLRLPGVSEPGAPPDVSVGLEGVTPWRTPNDSFYLIHTALIPPAIEPKDWQLRIHGMVDREVVLSYADLMARQPTEAWVTLNCVSNPVGGLLIGNAWWSGVRTADLLREAGVRDGADAVKQTSEDGWTCGTPLSALTDDRGALLAYAMNGDPLPIEHGFPVRTVVPGLYGYVSACKWVRQFEVTTFDSFSAYWTERGWSAQGPIKLASRIDVPGDGHQVKAGRVRVGGLAWQQNTGISGVQVQLDGGGWQPATLGRKNLKDSWLQWEATVDASPGRHRLACRAVNDDGQVQTAVRADPVPDGASGWHTVTFSAD